MKLLTLNTHSLIEKNYSEKLRGFVDFTAKETPDIIALQEVNQSITEKPVPKEKLCGYIPCGSNITIRGDNHVYNAVRLLNERKIGYYWTYITIKRGYGIYDEGLAVMSRFPIEDTAVFTISAEDNYKDWKTRKAVGVKVGGEWFFSVHYGWWEDTDSFLGQWERTTKAISNYGKVWIMGDFNNPAEIRNEGYDLIKATGFYDTFLLADKKDSGITVSEVIDGWKERTVEAKGIRIDQIWCSYKAEIAESKVVFNGESSPVISDHYGVLVYTKG